MPHPALWAAAGAAAATGYKLIRRELRRVNRALDEARRERIDGLPGVPLERDPKSGIYRVRREESR